eukprot:jgi/Chrzof1/5730/Cz16g13110.t1
MCSPGSDTKFAVFVLDGVQAITYLRMTHNVLYLRLTGLYNTQGFCLRSGYRCQKLGGRFKLNPEWIIEIYLNEFE